ncbi:hypothetical protein ACAH01_01235 [Halomicrobium sp. HM KBTZ05]|uniref:hypothetical protein n=1 Tax=Halomicrobium sp. HM KBTZ05 TaxID=3242663 RepID=UPI003557FC69
MDNEQQLPIVASGTSTHTFEPDGEQIIHRHRFESDALAERYGDPVIEFEPERLPRERVPDSLQDGGKTSVTATRVIGTFEEHRTAEKEIWDASSDTVSAQHHLDDEIPLYHYESADTSGERKAPINVAWDVSTASDAEDHYADECNWVSAPQPDVKRYIVTDDGVKSNDTRIQKTLGGDDIIWLGPIPIPTDIYEQIDIRVYNYGEEPYPVLGQAHIDPWDHNQDCKFTGVGCQDWQFNAARTATKDCWTDGQEHSSWIHSLDYSEQDFDTHDGKIALLS